MGFTRDAAKLIAKHERKYIDKSDTSWKLKWDELLESEEDLIMEESERAILIQEI